MAQANQQTKISRNDENQGCLHKESFKLKEKKSIFEICIIYLLESS